MKTHRIEDIKVKMCPLDMTEIGADEIMIVTPCNHAFHLECLKKVIGDQTKVLKTCPCCKENLKDFKITY